MKKVLFLCTGNSARSIISECLMNQMGESQHHAHSAGSKPTGTVNPFSIQVLKKNNINCDGTSSKSWDAFKDMKFDFVVTVCNNTANETCPIYPGSLKKIHWDIEDPAAFQGSDEEKLNEFQRVFDIIKKKLKKNF
ncbi:arsenate reductase ArsC [Pelagibacteraceae bacterium]|nr:arsenate reductase ArsC [Pelagibacteraceae bacterium]